MLAAASDRRRWLALLRRVSGKAIPGLACPLRDWKPVETPVSRASAPALLDQVGVMDAAQVQA